MIDRTMCTDSFVVAGDLLIKRVDNGWIVHEKKYDEIKSDDYIVSVVFEDSPEEYGDAESLVSLMNYVFADYKQQNYCGGFELTFKKVGKRQK